MKSPETRAAKRTFVLAAAAIINCEFERLNLDPLNSEQIDALGDESQAFEMLDDFEARLGCSDSEIAEARALLVEVFADTNPAGPKGEPMTEPAVAAAPSVLNINAELLRSWSACSDGFKWFLHNFPQGGEFGAVYDELRKQRRYSDSSWLCNRVFENAISEPGAVGKIVVSLGADESAIVAEVKAKCDTETTSAVDKARLAASGNYSRLAASGYASRLAASGNDSSLAASGYDSSLAASGNYSRLAASGNDSRLAASGNDSRLAASGNYSRLAASGNYSRLAASGYASRLAASGNDSRLAASGYDSSLAASGNDSSLAASGYDSSLAASGNYSRLAASGNDSRLAASGDNSLCMAASGAVVSAGPGSAIAIEWYDGNRRRIAVAYVGENAIEPNVAYRVNDSGEFVRVEQ